MYPMKNIIIVQDQEKLKTIFPLYILCKFMINYSIIMV